MKKKLLLFRCKVSFLFYDALSWCVGENWDTLRKESNTTYKLIEIALRHSKK